MVDVRAASIALSELFIAEVEARCPALALASPRNPAERGSQVSFAFEHGYPAMQALIDRGVIGDFRAPDIMRFGFTPLYIDEADVLAAAETLETVIARELTLWRDPKYQIRSRGDMKREQARTQAEWGTARSRSRRLRLAVEHEIVAARISGEAAMSLASVKALTFDTGWDHSRLAFRASKAHWRRPAPGTGSRRTGFILPTSSGAARWGR